jgi:threonine/homoserine/homoserine lactone efflux protein
MTGLLFQGIFLGFTLAILVGPAFFTLLQTSIHRGFKSGIFLALGISLSDTTLVALCVLGLSQILSEDSHRIYFGLIGGLILIIFGIVTFTRKLESFTNNDDDNGFKKPGFVTFILKGFFLNIANPILIIFWVGVVSGVISSAEPGKLLNYVIVFFSGALITTFSTDILKCFIANKIKSYLKPKVLVIINHTIGVLLVLFGIVLILKEFILKTV